jgi:hypothetical protein
MDIIRSEEDSINVRQKMGGTFLILVRDLWVVAFTVVIFQVEVFWVVTPCSVVVGYQLFSSPRCLHLQGSLVLRNVGNLLQHYTTSQPRRPLLEVLILVNGTD